MRHQQHNSGTPTALKELCGQLLEKDPDYRPSARELLQKPYVIHDVTRVGLHKLFTKRSRSLETLASGCSDTDEDGDLGHNKIVARIRNWLGRDSYDAFRPRFHMKSYCEVCAAHCEGSVVCEFTPLRRRHHCRMCGRSVCLEHAVGRRALPQLGYKKPQMLCETCFLLPRDIAARKVKDGRGRPRSAAWQRRSCRRRAHSGRVESFHRVRAERANSARGRAHSVRVERARSPDPDYAERLARSRSTTPTAPGDVSPAPLTVPDAEGRYLPVRKGLLPFRQCFRSHAEDERKSSHKIFEEPEAEKVSVPVGPEQEPARAKDAKRERSHRLFRRLRRDASPPTSEVAKSCHGGEPEKEPSDAQVRSDSASGWCADWVWIMFQELMGIIVLLSDVASAVLGRY